ncbi:hypothetical protein GW17_00047816 [Ensete ventricosum]|nr:hypothetical protein GW17_00047816 [Ensete ventricosum]RZR75716.1 hypothetical protein BHM03_00000196 [Ensete ventricosum]
MASHHLCKWLPFLSALSCLPVLALAARSTPSSTIKAVNLGGWLVTEGWIEPSLFDAIPNKDFLFRVFNGQFVGLSDQGNGVDVVAVSTSPGESETFEIVVNANDPSLTPTLRRLSLEGHFELWTTPSPGQSKKLRSMPLNLKYNLRVIIDLHAAPGSQNGYEHSASRDGSIEWGTTDSIDQTVAVIEFLAARFVVPSSCRSVNCNIKHRNELIHLPLLRRYAQRQSLLAVELLNEPRASGVPLDTLKNYYQAGYDAVRKHTTSAYVIMSNRLSGSSTELLQFASGLSRSVVDVHYYNLYTDIFNGMTVQQNIDYVNNNRSSELNTVITANGPLVFVGN